MTRDVKLLARYSLEAGQHLEAILEVNSGRVKFVITDGLHSTEIEPQVAHTLVLMLRR